MKHSIKQKVNVIFIIETLIFLRALYFFTLYLTHLGLYNNNIITYRAIVFFQVRYNKEEKFNFHKRKSLKI